MHLKLRRKPEIGLRRLRLLELRLSDVAQLAATPAFSTLRAALQAYQARLLAETVTIQQIASPTFEESERAAYVQARLAALSALDQSSVCTDDLYNVYACLRGNDPSRPALLVSAHTDTVFSRQTSLSVKQTAETLCGAGIGDNSLGVAALLAAAELLSQSHVRLPSDVWFVANSREEGLGNLDGIRAVYARLGRCLGRAIVIEGMALGHVYIGGIAVKRLRIACYTEGGHSWLHFGRPSAIHHLMRLGAQIAALRPPESPRSTYNIGVIEGGRSVNSIAAEASLLLDLRSETREGLAALERSVLNLIDLNRTNGVRFEVTTIGERPSGSIPRSHPLVQLAHETLTYLGIQPIFEHGSTDANALLAHGLPTITIGITRGGNAHREDEFIEIAPILDGVWQLLLLIGAAAHLPAHPD
ncbi:MAG: M20/M25/M40 family metallo-hydrolase [Anaerolineae bacterium]|nr:M20/M25/M40 family metallo-hydrolase [Anaerolineae bacterium]MDW8299208.1 M20/M25/M40 family metallo-hydrolase [Anaerolineae bacterium]